MSEWRDISTAPKNTRVLIYLPWINEVHLGRYSTGSLRAHAGWRAYFNTQGKGSVLYGDPTHWQPLPEPPKPIAAHLNRQPSDDLGRPSDSEASS